MVEVTAGLTEEEQTLLIRLLQKVRQPWSPAFFNAIKPLVAMTAIEVVIMRWHHGNVQVVLTQRSKMDKHWPEQLHSPGSMLRGTDIDKQQNHRHPFKRVLDEIGLSTFSVQPVLVDAIPVPTRRGPEHGVLFIAQIEGDPKIGKFWNVNDALNLSLDVSGGLIPEHRNILCRAKDRFQKVYEHLLHNPVRTIWD